MLLFWGIFTVGFFFGAILSYLVFAAKTPEEEENRKINPKTGYLISKYHLNQYRENLKLDTAILGKTPS